MRKFNLSVVPAMAMTLFFFATAAADITDFNTWTLVEDPAHPNFGSSVDSASQITLTANGGPIPAGTDIGYQSINGLTPATSTQGYYFDHTSDFSVAVDFNMNFSNANGVLAFGFGIGEDQNGENGAGATLVTNNGSPLAFLYASQTNGSESGGLITGPTLQTSARMITTYDASSGDIVVGVSDDNDDIAEGSFTFSGLQNNWSDGDLLVSFFIRSDQFLTFNPWQSGSSDTTVTNFRVLSGTPIAAVPEPQSAILLVGFSLYFVSRRKRRQR
jgi:hypothetical protein